MGDRAKFTLGYGGAALPSLDERTANPGTPDPERKRRGTQKKNYKAVIYLFTLLNNYIIIFTTTFS